MILQSLNGIWTLEIPGSEFPETKASVPGSVYHDLLTAGQISDPFYRSNEDEALKIMEHDFIYSRSFEAGSELLNCDAVLLRCHGLDTLAETEINGRSAGKADNMHRTWEYNVKPLLHEGENEIRITLSSPTKFIREANEKKPQQWPTDAMKGFSFLRKAHCMFGWDWGPHLPDAGIWRDIELIGIRKARLRDVYIPQVHESGKVTLNIASHIEMITEGKTEVSISATAPDGKIFSAEGTE